MLCRLSSERKIINLQNQGVGGSETLRLDKFFNATLRVVRSMVPVGTKPQFNILTASVLLSAK